MTKPRSPKPSRSLPQRRRRARAELFRGSLARFHAREDGRLYDGAAEFAAMWRAIPWLRPLGLLARLPVLSGLLELGYRFFLKLRPGLQRLVGEREKPRAEAQRHVLPALQRGFLR